MDSSVDGKLAHNQPIARPCYQGPGYSPELCQSVSSNWTSNIYLAAFPIGYSYPVVESCPPINATVAGYPQCDLGNYAVYQLTPSRKRQRLILRLASSLQMIHCETG